MNPDDISQLAARFVIGQVAAEEIVEWAINCMQREIDSSTLSVIAGYTKAELFLDVHSFRDETTKLFKEFGVVIPSMNEAPGEVGFLIVRAAKYAIKLTL